MAEQSQTQTSYEEGLKGASESVAEFREDQGFVKRLQHWPLQNQAEVQM